MFEIKNQRKLQQITTQLITETVQLNQSMSCMINTLKLITDTCLKDIDDKDLKSIISHDIDDIKDSINASTI